MYLIYTPSGKALEYGELALNVYSGCSHKCGYCYVPGIFRKSREDWENQTPKPRFEPPIFLKKLQSDCDKLNSQMFEKPPIFLSFTSDLYQPIEESIGLGRDVISTLLKNGLGSVILTKSGDLPSRDFDLLKQHPQSKFGVTLTGGYEEYEKNAGHPVKRIELLKKAHEMGIKTWVSMEPVINPDYILYIIKQISPFVDEFKIGKWNHDSRAKYIDWEKFHNDVVNLLTSLKADYYIKKDLAKYASNNIF